MRDVKGARQDAIRRLLRARTVSTQEELGELLVKEGYDVTQATLSRDLAQLGAMRVSLPAGGTVYALESAPPPPGEERLREIGDLVLEVDDNDTLVMLRTRPGAAGAVALALDGARLAEVMGSIAGDDTIFVAPARGRSTRSLARRFKQLLGKGKAEDMLAKTDAAGATGLLPEVLAFSSSLSLDRRLLREDLVGSLAHLTMLARRGIIPRQEAALIRERLVDIWDQAEGGRLQLPDEEDVHMAVEAHLTRALGETAGLLHTARSRNDQVALDLRLHVRSQAARALLLLADLVEALATRAAGPEGQLVLPSYTHRQRAQPVSLAYTLCAWGAAFARDAEALCFVLSQVDALPLGVGAVGGTSLPIDREVTRGLLGFSRITLNGMDTVGDRDFALDFSYATARCLLHAGRVSTDMIDFSSGEFGFVTLDGAIACGSSMMPQKRNPDVFELIRGKSGRAVGNLTGLLVMLKGLPGGYNRDLQEDRQSLLETGPLLSEVLSMLRLGLSHVRFNGPRMEAALQGDYTQATDVAEALAMKGVPFRTAYKAVGTLVRRLQEARLPLSQVTLELAREVHPALDAEVLKAADVRRSVERKANQGGTGPASVAAQIEALTHAAAKARELAQRVPTLDALLAQLKEASL